MWFEGQRQKRRRKKNQYKHNIRHSHSLILTNRNLIIYMMYQSMK